MSQNSGAPKPSTLIEICEVWGTPVLRHSHLYIGMGQEAEISGQGGILPYDQELCLN